MMVACRRASVEAWLAELSVLHAADPSPVPEILAGNTGEVRGYPVYALHHVPQWSRDLVLPVFLRKAATDPRLRWLYNHQIPWDRAIASEAESHLGYDVQNGPGSGR